jgi:hypothetical protein
MLLLSVNINVLSTVKKSQFKKADAAEVRKNKIHMKKWMTKYAEDIGNMD